MPRKHRVKRADFPSRSRRIGGKLFSLSVSPLPSGHAKFSCVVSKKVALKAHDRNLIKRRCKEAARPLILKMKTPLVLVAYAKKEAAGASFAAIRADLESLLQSCQ
ncbi:MAG TPA: ribonuclease P protein component [Candidatus Paceibacterota bacterium]|nr:ribonuclease P protein component [Candidatus Paceibacterota bacterium]